MIPRIELLKIALAHAKSNPEFLRDDRGIPAYRFDGRSDLIGLFIPHSLYHATPDIEAMTTYELWNAGVFSRHELDIIHDINDVQIQDEELWVPTLQEMIDEFESGD
jgi:hypothetical protein